MTDIHQHVLWGIDDGPKDPEGMYKMLKNAHSQGITCIYATPHASPGMQPLDLELYHQRLKEAQEYCDANDLHITVLSGAEIFWTKQTVDTLRRGGVPTLGGGEYVLIELWESISWKEVRSIAEQVMQAGCMPVFAHIERYRCFRCWPGKAIALRKELGICYQVNATSVLYPHGFIRKRFLKKMLKAQAIDAVASDAHGRSGRPMRLRKAYKELVRRCGEEYAHRLLHFNGELE